MDRKAESDMEKTEKEPRGFYVAKGSFFAHASVTLLVLSMAARLLGTLNLWGDIRQLIIQTLLPVGCSLLFIVFILFLGRIALWATILPVLGGAAFYVLAIFDDGPGWPLFICIALAFLAAFVYTATVSGMIRSKWLLVVVFALIFAYQIVFRTRPVFGGGKDPGFYSGMTLLSSLGMVLAMLLASFAFRRRKKVKEEPELPKIKDPVVVSPSESMSGETPVGAQEASFETPEQPFFEDAPAAPEHFSAGPSDEGDPPAAEESRGE